MSCLISFIRINAPYHSNYLHKYFHKYRCKCQYRLRYIQYR